jgi:hypothetical protein
MLWRATTEAAPFLTGRSMIMAGHANQKFVAYPICPEAAAKGRSLVNWIAELAVDTKSPDRRDWNRRGNKADFAPAFANWTFDWLDIPARDRRGEVFEFPWWTAIPSNAGAGGSATQRARTRYIRRLQRRQAILAPRKALLAYHGTLDARLPRNTDQTAAACGEHRA